jgi:hypothetical protein
MRKFILFSICDLQKVVWLKIRPRSIESVSLSFKYFLKLIAIFSGGVYKMILPSML